MFSLRIQLGIWLNLPSWNIINYSKILWTIENACDALLLSPQPSLEVTGSFQAYGYLSVCLFAWEHSNSYGCVLSPKTGQDELVSQEDSWASDGLWLVENTPAFSPFSGRVLSYVLPAIMRIQPLISTPASPLLWLRTLDGCSALWVCMPVDQAFHMSWLMVLAETLWATMANPYPENISIPCGMKVLHVVTLTLRWFPQEIGLYQRFSASHYCWQIGHQEVAGASSLGK